MLIKLCQDIVPARFFKAQTSAVSGMSSRYCCFGNCAAGSKPI